MPTADADVDADADADADAASPSSLFPSFSRARRGRGVSRASGAGKAAARSEGLTIASRLWYLFVHERIGDNFRFGAVNQNTSFPATPENENI